MAENHFLASLGDLFAAADPSVLVGSGPDDCAHVLVEGKRLAVSTDAFVEGSHFLADTPARAVGYKAMTASLSDLAASGCRARWALCCLSLRRGLPPGWEGEFAQGIAEAAREFGVTVIGGDTVASRAAVFVAVTVLGEPLPGGPILRSGARPGDALVVTGALGGSLGGKHLRPVPRLREMRLLMEYCARAGAAAGGQIDVAVFFPGAAMDISDGLALDLSRLCRESGVGAEIEAGRIPVSPDAVAMAKTSGRQPLDHALSDGEDFELLLALPPRVWEGFRSFLETPAGKTAAAGLAPFTRIGTVRDGRELIMRLADGGTRPLAAEGYEHTW